MIYIRMTANGLGNQMFSYAYGRYLSKISDDKIILDYSDSKKKGQEHGDEFESRLGKLNLKYEGIIYSKKELIRAVGLRCLPYFIIRKMSNLFTNSDEMLNKWERKKAKINVQNGLYFDDDVFFFDEMFMSRSTSKDIIVQGLWQNGKYLDFIRNELIEEFDFREVIDGTIQKIIDEIDSNSVCIHCRRGDYINHPIMCLCTKEYYQAAVEYYNNSLGNTHFYVFSDDIGWVKNNIVFNNNVTYIEGNTSIQDMAIMSNFYNYILSNSTFSFWGQFLSTKYEKRIVAPQKWFLNGTKSLLVGEEWKVI